MYIVVYTVLSSSYPITRVIVILDDLLDYVMDCLSARLPSPLWISPADLLLMESNDTMDDALELREMLYREIVNVSS